MNTTDAEHNERVLKQFKVECAEPPVINGRLHMADFAGDMSGRLRIGRGVVINSSFESNPVGGERTVFCFKGPDALIEIDDHAGMSNVMIAAYEHVYIGKHVSLGAGCKIMDTDFHPLDPDERRRNVNIPHRPVRIEEDAFIGTNAIILKGVTIGRASVVAAGAVVAKSIPPGEIWGGNPAKFIRKL
jgi:acetyltransferase-like isoleucine patch superfamily enzyme